jgi:hypothetical protein
MRSFLKEPLLHFLILGAAIFVAHRIATGDAARDPQTIVVTQSQIATLTGGFSRVWQRPPTVEELEGLIQEHIREEVYYREALALGLDRDDPVVRRRLRQKVEFLSEDTAAQAEPTDHDLREYLGTHPELFRVDRQYSFTQVYLNPERHVGRLADDAAALIAELRATGTGVDFSAVGDRSLLEHRFEELPAGEVRKLFGEPFEARLAELEPGQWHGPINSGVGTHLVLIRERTEGRLPELDAVRAAVRNEWGNARREQAKEDYFQSLLKRYTVVREPHLPETARVHVPGTAQ